jgi:ABC-2 type transport system ATP-binding protein
MTAVVRFTLPMGLTTSDLPQELQALEQKDDSGLVNLRSAYPLREVGVLATWSSARGIEIPDLEVHRPTLEDVYLELTEGGTMTRSQP